MKPLLPFAVALASILCPPALACEGQVGKTIYEDTFADDSGGWDLVPPLTAIKPPNFVIVPGIDGNKGAISAQVLTFHAREADICVEGVIPKSISADTLFQLGIEFWAPDYTSYFVAQLDSAGTAGLVSWSNRQWTTIATVANAPGFKPDGSNALRVTTLGGRIAIFLNGQPVKTIRAQIPDGDLRFGLYGAITRPVDAPPPILLTSYKVTTGQ